MNASQREETATGISSTTITSPSITTSPESQFSMGDLVQIYNDADRVRELQQGHGEWTEVMEAVCDMFGV